MATRLRVMIGTLRSILASRITYDTSHPWIMYRYQVPDAIAHLVGFSIVRADCLICGKQHRVWLRVWRQNPETGKAARLGIVQQHRHTELRWNPMVWVDSTSNYAGWREWRASQRHGH